MKKYIAKRNPKPYQRNQQPTLYKSIDKGNHLLVQFWVRKYFGYLREESKLRGQTQNQLNEQQSSVYQHFSSQTDNLSQSDRRNEKLQQVGVYQEEIDQQSSEMKYQNQSKQSQMEAQDTKLAQKDQILKQANSASEVNSIKVRQQRSAEALVKIKDLYEQKRMSYILTFVKNIEQKYLFSSKLKLKKPEEMESIQKQNS